MNEWIIIIMIIIIITHFYNTIQFAPILRIERIVWRPFPRWWPLRCTAYRRRERSGWWRASSADQDRWRTPRPIRSSERVRSFRSASSGTRRTSSRHRAASLVTVATEKQAKLIESSKSHNWPVPVSQDICRHRMLSSKHDRKLWSILLIAPRFVS